MKKLLLPSLLVLALTGCPSTTETVADGDGDSQKAASTSAAVKPVEAKRLDGSGIPPELASRNSVFFDYDSYVIRSDGRQVVDSHARFLAQQPARKVTIQGNADERGSREYNLALGQKRAEAVRRALRLQGVNDTQMEAVSLGKEQPRCTSSTESCWAENRRGDFVYLR
jgi:peptidoglycan-associated lipoprotein